MNNENDGLDRNTYLPRIVGTLKWGWFSGESFKKQIFALILVESIFFLGIVFMVTMLVIEQINDPSSVTLFCISLIGGVVGLSICPIIFLILFTQNYKRRKDILLWLDDAIEVKAYSKTIGEFKPTFEIGSVRIQVIFKVNGTKYIRESKGKRMGVPEGFHQIWCQYADREINLLYSPKYDQVMILKDEAI